MTISYSAAGALSEHADSITPAYPSTPTAGELLALLVVSGHADDSIPTAPSGWTLVDSTSGGGGVFGAGAGPRRLTWFVREAAGGDAAPTTSIPSGSAGSLIAGRIHVATRSAGTGWRWAVSTGEDTTSDTAFSAVGAAALTWAPGDFALLAYGVNVATASATAEAIAATGITYGAVTEQTDDAVTSGHDARLVAATCTVSSGSGTQAPTVSATLAAAATGVASVLRLREATAALSASPQTAFPPRTLVSATGLLAEDIVTASITRQVGSAQTAVRAATDVDVTGQDALLRIDAEMPFGTVYSYVATLTDVNGLIWTVASGTLTTTATSDVISDAVSGLGAHVHIEDWTERKRTRDTTSMNVGGRWVTVGRPRSTSQSTVTVSTDTVEDGDALQAALNGLTEGVLLLRAQTTNARVDSYLALKGDGERPNWQTEYSEWDLDVDDAEAWPDVLEARGFTLQDIADNVSTLQDLHDQFPGTLLDIASYDWGA